MRIRIAKARQAGITLVEVVISTFILSIMAAGIIGCFAYGFFVMQLARENQRATQILLEKLETVRLYNWQQVLTQGFIPTQFTDVYDPQATTGSMGVTYQGQVTVGPAPFNNSYSDDMRQITVTLTWTSMRNMTRSRSVMTLVAKDGVQNYVY